MTITKDKTWAPGSPSHYVTITMWLTATRVSLRWWNQTGIDLEAATARGEGGETDSTSRSRSSTDGGKRNEEREEEESKASGSSGAEWSGASADEWE